MDLLCDSVDSPFIAHAMKLLSLPLLEPVCDFSFKVDIDDFRVTEVMGFEPTGSGEHGIFEVTKFGCTTHDVLQYVSKQFCVPRRDIGYAGLKDKVAVTTQWISIPLRYRHDSVSMESKLDSVRICFQGRHRQKLRPGCHWGNEFSILLRNVVGDKRAVEDRLMHLSAGFPNLFGPQRFGRRCGNLRHFARWKSGQRLKRQAKQMAISAVRSMGFNQAVASRWWSLDLRTAWPGDWLMWRGSKSVYRSFGGEVDQQRLATEEVDLAFPLLDESVLWRYCQEYGSWPPWSYVMKNLIGNVAHWRRSWVKPQSLTWCWEGDVHLRLSFQLEKGAFATTLISMLGQWREQNVTT